MFFWYTSKNVENLNSMHNLFLSQCLSVLQNAGWETELGGVFRFSYTWHTDYQKKNVLQSPSHFGTKEFKQKAWHTVGIQEISKQANHGISELIFLQWLCLFYQKQNSHQKHWFLRIVPTDIPFPGTVWFWQLYKLPSDL